MTNQSPDYRAGLKAAAGICEKVAVGYAGHFDHISIGAAIQCQEAIRAAIEQSQPQKATLKTERDAFENWIITSKRATKYHLESWDNGEYLDTNIQLRWAGWKARPESQPQEVQPVATVVNKHPDNTMSWLIEPALPVGTPLFDHPYDHAALAAAGFASVEDLLAAWQGAQKDAARYQWRRNDEMQNDKTKRWGPYISARTAKGEIVSRYAETSAEYDAAIDHAICASIMESLYAAAPAPENKK